MKLVWRLNLEGMLIANALYDTEHATQRRRIRIHTINSGKFKCFMHTMQRRAVLDIPILNPNHKVAFVGNTGRPNVHVVGSGIIMLFIITKIS